MAYPIIILGAGASYDYIDDDEVGRSTAYKPPLANEIFNHRFNDIMLEFEKMRPLPGNVTTELKSGKSLEAYLTEIKNNAAQTPSRKVQLAAFLFYLHKLFQKNIR